MSVAEQHVVVCSRSGKVYYSDLPVSFGAHHLEVSQDDIATFLCIPLVGLQSVLEDGEKDTARCLHFEKSSVCLYNCTDDVTILLIHPRQKTLHDHVFRRQACLIHRIFLMVGGANIWLMLLRKSRQGCILRLNRLIKIAKLLFCQNQAYLVPMLERVHVNEYILPAMVDTLRVALRDAEKVPATDDSALQSPRPGARLRSGVRRLSEFSKKSPSGSHSGSPPVGPGGRQKPSRRYSYDASSQVPSGMKSRLSPLTESAPYAVPKMSHAILAVGTKVVAHTSLPAWRTLSARALWLLLLYGEAAISDSDSRAHINQWQWERSAPANVEETTDCDTEPLPRRSSTQSLQEDEVSSTSHTDCSLLFLPLSKTPVSSMLASALGLSSETSTDNIDVVGGVNQVGGSGGLSPGGGGVGPHVDEPPTGKRFSTPWDTPETGLKPCLVYSSTLPPPSVIKRLRELRNAQHRGFDSRRRRSSAHSTDSDFACGDVKAAACAPEPDTPMSTAVAPEPNPTPTAVAPEPDTPTSTVVAFEPDTPTSTAVAPEPNPTPTAVASEPDTPTSSGCAPGSGCETGIHTPSDDVGRSDSGPRILCGSGSGSGGCAEATGGDVQSNVDRATDGCRKVSAGQLACGILDISLADGNLAASYSRTGETYESGGDDVDMKSYGPSGRPVGDVRFVSPRPVDGAMTSCVGVANENLITRAIDRATSEKNTTTTTAT
eukprot:Rmarinus@m.18912